MVVTPPPFLVALGLAFWGWAAGLLLPALALALVIESPRIAKSRWRFDDKDFERVADLCSIAFLMLMAWQWFGSRAGPSGLVVVLTWLPIIFVAILLMQRFDARNTIPLSALFWSLRHRRAHGPPPSLPLEYPFFCLCLVSAACANQRSAWFFGGLVLLAIYALYPLRAEGRRLGSWGVALGLALGLGYAMQIGILRAQEQVESFVMEYLRDRVFGRADPFRAHTAIGDVGRVKLSDRILFRVAGVKTLPLKLRDGTFNVHAHDSWFGQGSSFRPVPPEGTSSWIIGEGAGPSLQISAWLTRGRATLPLPPGVFRLDDLNVGRVEANTFGSVRVSEGPDLMLFSARSDSTRERDAMPGPADLQVPKRIEAALMQVLAESGSSGLPPAEIARKLERFFQEHFAYTLRLDAREGGRRTLEHFLLDDRRGHCEYFASAATLLLRAAGVPARYATGYVVEEWSPLERQFVVRARHAHAWTLAWIDGRWREVDATPAGWFAAEAEAEPVWRPAADFLSWLGFAFQRWRVSGDESDTGMSPLWLLVVIPLAGWVAWRVTRRNRVKPSATVASLQESAGSSPIEPLLERLEALGFRRPAAASLRPWLQSLPLSPALQSAAVSVAHTYARWRFDPANTDPTTESTLRSQIAALAHQIEAGAANTSDDSTQRHGTASS